MCIKYLLKACFVASLSVLVESFNLLLIGDSFDRNFVTDWCFEKTQLSGSAIHWGHTNLSADPQRRQLFCRNIDNDTAATLFIFGSNLTHPYHLEHNTTHDDTKYRVSLGLREYFKLIDGLPDRIMISTTQWDATYLSIAEPWVSRGDFRYKESLAHLTRSHNILLKFVIKIVNEEIKQRCVKLFPMRQLYHKPKTLNLHRTAKPHQQFLKNSTSFSHSHINTPNLNHKVMHIQPFCGLFVDIGLRSTTRNDQTIDGLITDLNELNHNITIQRNLTWYDMEADIWSYSDYHDDNKLFRDWSHPIKALSTPIINKMMGKQYTQFISHHGGVKRLSHIITDKSVVDSNLYRNVNIQIIRCVALNNHTKNNQIVQIHNVTNNTIYHHIPGFGPIYFSTFINGSRVKWFIGDVSVALNAQSRNYSVNLQYEQHMRLVLRQLVLTTSDLVLLADDLLDSISTQGVMPILFNNTYPTAFTVRNNTNTNGFDLYLTTTIDKRPRIVAIESTVSVIKQITQNTNFIKLYKNIDPFWLSIIQSPQYDRAIPSTLFDHNRLLRHFRDPSVQVVLNGTRHYFSGLESFTRRGYDFSNVLKYNDALTLYVDLMPIGEVLT